MCMDLRIRYRCFRRVNSFDFLWCLPLLYLPVHLVHWTIAVMNQNVQLTNKISMTIFNLEVEDRGRLIKFKEIYALDSCGIPILGVNNIVRCKIRCIYPTSTLDLEGMRFGIPENFAVNVIIIRLLLFVNWKLRTSNEVRRKIVQLWLGINV